MMNKEKRLEKYDLSMNLIDSQTYDIYVWIMKRDHVISPEELGLVIEYFKIIHIDAREEVRKSI